MTNLAGKLPKDNGLDSISDELVDALETRRTFVVVGVVATATVKTDEEMVSVPTVRFRAVEVATGETAEQLLTTLAQLRAARRGDAQLDFSEPSHVDAEED